MATAEQHDTVIVGAGQSALAMSYWLSRAGREHVLLERGAVAERWRRERWDSLHFQFTNSYLRLPGHEYRGPEPGVFAHYLDILRYIERYGERIAAPVRSGVEVCRLQHDPATARFRLTTDVGVIEARRVVIATGPFQRPQRPACAAALPPGVQQLYASGYRNPAQLAPGAVLVIGSGSSGCQIAEELQHSGRTVYLSVGRHRRIPHRYRGRGMIDWLADTGLLDLPISAMPGGIPPPPVLVTGVNGGHSLNVRRLAADGAVLLGKLVGIEAGRAQFAADVEARLREADQSALDMMLRVDDYIRRTAVAAAAPDPEPSPAPRRGQAAEVPTTLDLAAAGVSAVIWCTGYAYDFGWVRLPVFDAAGQPLQQRGVTCCRGAYFLGLHWMHTFKSGTLFGVGQDAEYLAGQIAQSGD